MTCEECEQLLLDSRNCFSYKGWMPGVSILNLARSHAQSCPACAAKMSEIAEMNDALDQLRLSTRHMEAPPAVEMNLVAKFHKGITARTPSVATTFPWRWVWGPAAVLLLVAAGFVLYSTLKPRSPIAVHTGGGEQEHLAQRQLSRVPSGATAGGIGIEDHLSNADRIVTASPGGNVAKVGKPGHEQMRRFPLPVGDQLSLNGGSRVVRVRLSLSSLVAVGVPVSPDVSDRRVTADVMMDPFGAVVAIRLVQVETSMN
jgi:hypothetical protein